LVAGPGSGLSEEPASGWVMSPTSTSSRAATEGPIPGRFISPVPVAARKFGELLVGGLLPLVDPLQVADQLRRHATAGLPGRITRSHPRRQCPGLPGRQVLLRTARDQLEEQLVQLGDHPGVVVAERSTAVDQDPQDGELFVVDHRPQSGHPGADQRTECASVASVLRPCPVAKTLVRADCLGGTSTTHFAVGERPVGDVLADAGATPRWPRPDPATVCRSAASRRSRHDRSRTGHHREWPPPRSLPRSLLSVCAGPSRSPHGPGCDQISTPSTSPMLDPLRAIEPGGQRCFECDKPFLSLSWP
jgi:hypothetical protein